MQNTPTWLAAGIYFLIGGFFIPFLIGWLAGLILPSVLFAGIGGAITSLVLAVVSLAIGTYIAARLVQSYFSIESKEAVITLATVFFVLVGFLLLLSHIPTGFFVGLILLLIETAVFYFLSSFNFKG